MKKTMLLIVTAALLLIVPSLAGAQTANGTLTITATVNSSIKLVFNSDAAGVPLSSGAGTSVATLAFGNISAFGAIAANVTRTVIAGTSFTVSTPVDVNVTKSNSASANYALTAQLGAADAVNTWKVGGIAVTNSSAVPILLNGAYAVNTPETVAITVPFTTANGTVISNTINFTASAN